MLTKSLSQLQSSNESNLARNVIKWDKNVINVY